MADSYPGPYQSKLLKFISKQSRQVADRCDRTWREIKVVTLNATQIMLYPAYLLVQGSRMLARQLRESTQKVDLPELSEFVGGENQNLSEVEIGSESAIGEILHLAENLLLPSQTATSSHNFSFVINSTNTAADIQLQPELQLSGKIAKAQKNSVLETQLAKTPIDDSVAEISNKPQVQGIATFIAARTLVLVGTENQILDILTSEQQELLEGRIIWEVANSGPERRQIAEKELKFNLGLESAAEKSKHSPVGRFWQLMTWIQTSPIALKRNQFGESILAVKKAINASANRNLIAAQTASAQLQGLQIDQPAISASNSIDQNSPEFNFNNKFDQPTNNLSFVTLLDRAAANLEEISLLPVSKITDTFTEIGPANPDSNLSPSAREILETYARSIESAIWSSVDYLLGKETAASDNTEKSVAIKYYLEHQRLKNTETNGSEADRPWLNWQDLFGEPAPGTTVGAAPPCPPSSSITPPCPPSITQTSIKVNLKTTELEKLPEGRSVSISTSPYPEAIQGLLAQLKRSLFTKGEKSQPQEASNLPSTQQNSAARAESGSTPGDAQEAQPPKPTANNAQIGKSPAAITPQTSRFVATASTGSASKSKNHSADPEQGNDYLETKAESMGYIKHPLEQVLEWLDRIMLRLETIVEQVWKWAKINLPKIIRSKDKID
ncbi:MAG: hypothetical protein HC942_15140 [Microcoleus sp. SU_5_6]|nr:hypothetical protein [Microcoleus sp. SU_5_6]